jgi:hypothetical protein
MLSPQQLIFDKGYEVGFNEALDTVKEWLLEARQINVNVAELIKRAELYKL